MDHPSLLFQLKKQLIKVTRSNKYKVKNACQRGELVALAPGQYIEGNFFEAQKPWDKMLLRAMAVGYAENNYVLSHESAARIHGYDVLFVEEDVHIRSDTKRGHIAKGIKLHYYQYPIDAVDMMGLSVTHPAQTVIDCAKTFSYKEALVVADSALKRGMRKEHLKRYLDDMGIRQGLGKVLRVIEAATSLSGSAGETECRVVLERIGMPNPILQYPIYARGRRYYADFAFPGLARFQGKKGLVVEFDGYSKYKNYGASAQDNVIQERRRETNIMSKGWEVVRLTTDDVRDETMLRSALSGYL